MPKFTAASIFAHYANDDTLDLDLIGVDEDRLHGRIGRLQANAAARIPVELFQRDVGSAHEGDDHFAVVGGLAILDHHKIAIADLLVDHRVAPHAQHVGVALAGKILRYGNRFVGCDGFDRKAGGDIPEKRQLDGPSAGSSRHHLHRSTAVPRTPNE